MHVKQYSTNLVSVITGTDIIPRLNHT